MAQSTPFSVRALVDAVEVEPWLDFVASCFAFKGTPRDHFSKHFYLDPWRDHKAIVVAEDGQQDADKGLEPAERSMKQHKTDAKSLLKTCVSTLRCFRRKLYIGGKITECAGIGEVCTREDRRRLGLSNLVLTFALDSMNADGCAMAALHSSQMAVVYSKAGFETIPLGFCTQTFKALPPAKTKESEVHAADMKNKDLVSELMPLHASFNSEFDGPVVRDDADYWSGYMLSNMQDPGYVLRRTWPSTSSAEKSCAEQPAAPVAFASLKANKAQPGAFLLADFFTSPSEVEADGGLQALQLLVGAALHGRGIEEARVQLPRAVAQRLGGRGSAAAQQATPRNEDSAPQSQDGGAAATEGPNTVFKADGPDTVDLGFMYKQLGDGPGPCPDPERHAFWPADAY